jgi:hypothetical protein
MWLGYSPIFTSPVKLSLELAVLTWPSEIHFWPLPTPHRSLIGESSPEQAMGVLNHRVITKVYSPLFDRGIQLDSACVSL